MLDIDINDILSYINPSVLDYTEWVQVGMALKHEGYDCNIWDDWSKRDSGRYHAGDCEKKWKSFNGNGSPVTGGTLVLMAQENGWHPISDDTGYSFDWDDTIGGKKDDYKVINEGWFEPEEISDNKMSLVQQIIKYLETLFEPSEQVGYVTGTWVKDDKYLPTKGNYDRTAGELIEALSKCNGDIGSVLGDTKEEAGAWIRFNPLDGKGVKNENVTEYRYALVESDTADIETQNAIFRNLELPIACLVYSGKKSLHAIVRIDAPDYNEYRKRVDFLYSVCQKNGLEIDKQNKNPSRLSRMPGIRRNGVIQRLVDVNIGKENWAEWRDWIEAINDDLPDTDNMSDFWDNIPPLADPLIDSILRQGHKMLIAGPSKAGKSFALIELCCAIAEGRKWLGHKCTKGKVLYVNLELDRASCFHRFKDVYNALGYTPDSINNIDIWNLRGKSLPMDKLAPKLIRRAYKKNYIAIIIDPIYKVITGDENSADQMAHFCNQFDKVCNELGCAVIYCHHHSKGAQGDKKSMDRASGSGVFARDPDAILDLIELEITPSLLKQQQDSAECSVYIKWLDEYAKDWQEDNSEDVLSSTFLLNKIIDSTHNLSRYSGQIKQEVTNARKEVQSCTAWRIEGTLREFQKLEPINVWFDFPVHKIDDVGILKDLSSRINSKNSPYGSNFKGRKTKEENKEERNNAFEMAFNMCAVYGSATLKDLAEYMGTSDRTIRNRVSENENFFFDKNDSLVKRNEKVE